MMLAVLLPPAVLPLLVCSQLPTALRREQDTLISNDALKGFYIAAEIAAVLAAAHGIRFFLGKYPVYWVTCMVVMAVLVNSLLFSYAT